MKKETSINLSLTLSQAKEIYKTANSDIKKVLELNFGKKEFSTDKTEIIENFYDILCYFNINSFEFSQSLVNLSKKEVAFRKIQLIEKCFNEYKEFGEYKYWPYFTRNDSGLGFHRSACSAYYSHGPVGVFTSQKDSDYVGNTFIDIYKEFILD